MPKLPFASEGKSLPEVLEEFRFMWADDMLLSDLAMKLSCGESDALADVLEVLGEADMAGYLRSEHKIGDEPGDVHYVCGEMDDDDREHEINDAGFCENCEKSKRELGLGDEPGED